MTGSSGSTEEDTAPGVSPSATSAKATTAPITSDLQTVAVAALHGAIRAAFVTANNIPNLALPQDILRDFSRVPFVRGGCHAVLKYYLTPLRVYTSLGEIDDVTRVARILLAPSNWEIKWSEGKGLSLFKKVENNRQGIENAFETWISL